MLCEVREGISANQSVQGGPGRTKVMSADVAPAATLIRWTRLDSRDFMIFPALWLAQS
jgi:hypothetical protein